MPEITNIAEVNVSEKFKKRRIEKKLTQGQLAIKSGIKRSSIADYENGRMLPSLQRFFILCRVLEIKNLNE